MLIEFATERALGATFLGNPELLRGQPGDGVWIFAIGLHDALLNSILPRIMQLGPHGPFSSPLRAPFAYFGRVLCNSTGARFARMRRLSISTATEKAIAK